MISRTTGSDWALAFYNFSDAQIDLTLRKAPFEAGSPTDLISGESLPPMNADQPYTLTLAPAGAVILVP